MEKENRSCMVNLASVRQIKIIVFASIVLFISTKINAAITCPWWVRGGKTFKMIVTTANPAAVGTSFSFKIARSSDGGGTFGGDVLGHLTPRGGQFGIINGVLDTTQLGRWESSASYDYKNPYGIDDYLRIYLWCSYPGGNEVLEDSTDINIKNSYNRGGIDIDHNPISSKDFSDKGGLKITIYPIPKGGEVPVVKIFDAFGYLVKDFPASEIHGYQEADSLYGVVYWDGHNQRGNKVASGVYEVCVRMIKGEEAEIWRRKFAVSR